MIEMISDAGHDVNVSTLVLFMFLLT